MFTEHDAGKIGFIQTGFQNTGLTPDQSYVQSIYVNILGREGTLDELNLKVRDLRSVGRQKFVRNIENSVEARTRLVRSWYVTYLCRNALNGEERVWVQKLRSGRPEASSSSRRLPDTSFIA